MQCNLFITPQQGRAQKFEKGGGGQFPVSVSTENIGGDQKKGLHVFRRPIYPQN